MKCPKCGSKRIKRSHSRGLKEQLQKLFNQKPYRCIDCDWRGTLQQLPTNVKHRKVIIKIISILLTAFTIIYLLYWLSKEPEEQIEQLGQAYISLNTFS
jgi:uncharacterized membrane protein YvbJ